MTKDRAESARSSSSRVEVGLVCDDGTSRAGLYGLTDLFTYAGDVAARSSGEGAISPVRISHWQAGDDNRDVCCTYDSTPGHPNAPAVLLVPGNPEAPLEDERNSPLIPWLRKQHSQGVVLAAGFIGMGPFGEMICANPFSSSPFSPGWRQCPRRLNHRRAIPGVSGGQRGAACRAISTAIRNAGPRCPASVGGVCAARKIAVWIANRPGVPRPSPKEAQDSFSMLAALGERAAVKSAPASLLRGVGNAACQ
jgi:hypothetical protein